MKHSKSALVRVAACILFCLSVAPTAAGEILQTLLQGESASDIAGAVSDAGGTVTHQLPLIDAVGARLTRDQLDRVLATGVVRDHMDDLAQLDPPEEDDAACRVRGHIELTIRRDGIRWALYNKMPAPARWKSLQLAWPASLGRITDLSIDGESLQPARYEHQQTGAVAIELPPDALSPITSRAELSVSFSGPANSEPPQPAPAQSQFDITAGFVGDCEAELVPGYAHNHEDFYYNTVAGVSPLQQEGVRGQGVTVAVVDSGLWQHPALMQDTRGRKRVLARYDAITDTAGAEVVDESGHGTHMTSIIAHSGPTLRQGQATGSYKGVAPDVDIVAVKILDREGFAQLLDIVRAIQWVVEHREQYNIRVLNLSFAQRPRWHYWDDPVNQAVMHAWAAGIVVVAAAGNEGPDPMTVGSPGNLPYIITVGAVTDSWTADDRSDDYIPDFSSRGPTPAGYVKPDVVALGGHMTGLTHPDSDLALTRPEDILGSGEYVSTGSSQAAALVSGIVALLLQLDPELSPDDVKCKLISSAEPAINRDGKLAYSPFVQGWGLVSASRAVTLGDTGCGNPGMDIQADLDHSRHYYGPVLFDDEGNSSLPGYDHMIASEPSAKGLSDTRKWGVKAHVERLGDTAQEDETARQPYNWRELYTREKNTMEELARGTSSTPAEADATR